MPETLTTQSQTYYKLYFIVKILMIHIVSQLWHKVHIS